MHKKAKLRLCAAAAVFAVFLQSISVYASAFVGTPNPSAMHYGASTLSYGASVLYPESKMVSATVTYQSVHVILGESDIAHTIIVEVPALMHAFYEDYSRWLPGTPGADVAFTIQNNTGRTYQITGFELSADASNFYRTYNEAARDTYGTHSHQNLALVAALSDDAWYQLNQAYYGIDENTPYDRDLLHTMLLRSGNYPAYLTSKHETSPEMIELAKRYLFYRFLFTFDNDIHTITGLSASADSDELSASPFTITNYLDGALDNMVMRDIFCNPVGQDGFQSTLQLFNDARYINNSNGYSTQTIGFTLTLELLPEVPGPDPGPNPGPGPDPNPGPGPDPNPGPGPDPNPGPGPDPNPGPGPDPNPGPGPDPNPGPGPDPNPGPGPDPNPGPGPDPNPGPGPDPNPGPGPDPNPGPGPDPNPGPDPDPNPGSGSKDTYPGTDKRDVYPDGTSSITIEDTDIPLGDFERLPPFTSINDVPDTGVSGAVKGIACIGLFAFAAGGLTLPRMKRFRKL